MIFLLLFAIPLIAAVVVEYSFCRFPRRRLWRWVPPLLALAAAAAVTLYRYHGWSDGAENAPGESLIFIPGIPALGAFLGLWLGWRLWKRLWTPRIVEKKKR